MASFSGNFQRPLVAAAAVVVASLAPDKLPSHQSLDSCSTSDSLKEPNFLWVSHISASKLTDLSFLTRIRVPLPATSTNFFVPNSVAKLVPNLLGTSAGASSSLFLNSYQSAQLANGLPKPATFAKIHASPPDVLYTWHLPSPDARDVSGSSDCKSRTVVVLLGWLGSKQKHLKKYAEWYTCRGFHVITFTFPMSEVLSYQVGGKAEQDIDLLVNHLADWLEEEHGKHLLFHTFSNTGWLTYGVILEKFQRQDPSLMGKIKGCIVDSAPVAAPDPQVWASGFSAALLKKNSVATKMHLNSNDSNVELSVGRKTSVEPKPAATEAALLVILEKFFGVVLNLPTVKRRLSDVLNLLSSRQPNCPQMYIYSSADRVIPAKSVESFIEEQRRAGHEVRAYNFVSTPHVDHFRNDPKLYGAQLSRFLDDCVLTSCKHT